MQENLTQRHFQHSIMIHWKKVLGGTLQTNPNPHTPRVYHFLQRRVEEAPTGYIILKQTGLCDNK